MVRVNLYIHKRRKLSDRVKASSLYLVAVLYDIASRLKGTVYLDKLRTAHLLSVYYKGNIAVLILVETFYLVFGFTAAGRIFYRDKAVLLQAGIKSDLDIVHDDSRRLARYTSCHVRRAVYGEMYFLSSLREKLIG